MTDNVPAPPEAEDPDADRPSERSDAAPTDPQPGKLPFKPEVLRLVGLGTELAGFTLVTMALAYGLASALSLDTRLATALGALIGFTLGMVRFIRSVTSLGND